MINQREIELIKLLVAGKNNKEIAEALSVSIPTVKVHLEKLYKKFGVRNRVQLAIKVISEELVSLDYLP